MQAGGSVIDGVLTILRLYQAQDVSPDYLYAGLPEGLTIDALRKLCSDKTGIRKMGERLCVTLPETGQNGASWIVWLFDHVPGVTELPGLVDKLKALSAGFARPQISAETVDRADAVSLALKQLAGATRRNEAALMQLAANVCVEAGLCDAVALARIREGKVQRIELSDQKLSSIADEIRFLLRERIADDASSEVVHRDSFAEENFDSALLSEMAESDSLLLDVPGKAEDSFGFILFSPAKEVATEIAGIRDLLTVLLARKKRTGLRAKVMRYAMIGAAAALVIWLLLPAPLRITATAISQPAQARSLALPFEVFLEEMHVRVGDQLTVGDPVARFRSPALEERRAEMALQTETEKIGAQAALSANDYGAYVLAEQRIATNERQLSHIEDRLAQLQVVAPENGRVIAAMGREIIGAFVPPGESIVTLQPEASFNLRLSVGRVDAPLLKLGQTGDVWFRGISGRTWPLTITAPAMQETNANTGQTELIFSARLEGDDQEDLFVGLAGFANIETGRAMRAKVLGRYITEYLRMKAWTWFDLRF